MKARVGVCVRTCIKQCVWVCVCAHMWSARDKALAVRLYGNGSLLGQGAKETKDSEPAENRNCLLEEA